MYCIRRDTARSICFCCGKKLADTSKNNRLEAIHCYEHSDSLSKWLMTGSNQRLWVTVSLTSKTFSG